jgi:hypothetical protein
MWAGGQRHAPAALPPGNTRYPLNRRLGGPQGRVTIVNLKQIIFAAILLFQFIIHVILSPMITVLLLLLYFTTILA